MKLGLMLSGFGWLFGDWLLAVARPDRHVESAIASAAFGLGLIIAGCRPRDRAEAESK